MDQTAFNLEFQELIEPLPQASREKFLQLYVGRAKNPLVGVGLAAFLGSLGVNRFYLGQHLLGSAKLGCFLLNVILLAAKAYDPLNPVLTTMQEVVGYQFSAWMIVDTFLMGALVTEKNLKIAQDIKSAMAPATIWQRG